MRLHSKVKPFKKEIVFRIYDITFKGVTPNVNEIFIIYALSNNKFKKPDELFKGDIFELRKSTIKA